MYSQQVKHLFPSGFADVTDVAVISRLRSLSNCNAAKLLTDLLPDQGSMDSILHDCVPEQVRLRFETQAAKLNGMTYAVVGTDSVLLGIVSGSSTLAEHLHKMGVTAKRLRLSSRSLGLSVEPLEALRE